MQLSLLRHSLDEVIWLICLLANHSIAIHNLWNPENKKEPLTEEMLELLTTPYELAEYKDAIMAAMYKGSKRYVKSEEESSKNIKAE